MLKFKGWFLPYNFFFLGGGQSLFHPCFLKNREAAYFSPPTQAEGGGVHSWPEYLLMFVIHLILQRYIFFVTNLPIFKNVLVNESK